MFLTSFFNPNDNYSGILGFDTAFIMGILFQWVNVAFIIFILSWLLYKPVRDYLYNRRERISKEIETAARNLQISQETKANYDAKLANVGLEREEILDAARKTANDRSSEIIAGANSEAGLILERARREIAQEREKARDEIREQIIQVSAMMAEQLLGSQINADEATKDRLLNQAIAELGDVSWRN